MKLPLAVKTLSGWDRRGRHVYTQSDLAHLFPADSPKTLQVSIDRLIQRGLLSRAARGIYVYEIGQGAGPDTIEYIVRAMRRGDYNYVSLESALSAYGVISQIPLDRLTVMTTGRKGAYRTPWGVIEFTHTARRAREILPRMRNVHRPLPLATPEAAWSDLKRVGRNTHLVDAEALADVAAR
ncbi:MAG: hypothetical protein L0H63_09015 [Nitrococcus sp.]|nr:hypothetical protein [Nitrococcus sp.]